jgi:hypothetical protein
MLDSVAAIAMKYYTVSCALLACTVCLAYRQLLLQQCYQHQLQLQVYIHVERSLCRLVLIQYHYAAQHVLCCTAFQQVLRL